MAALIPRAVCNLVRRTVLYPTFTAKRFMSDDDVKVEIHTGKKLARNETMADYLGHSSGMERNELITEAEGYESGMVCDYDYNRMVFDEDSPMGNGSLKKPFTVYCNDPLRFVECICEGEDSIYRYTMVTEGQPHRCHCGFWFQLTKRPTQEFVASPEDVHPELKS